MLKLKKYTKPIVNAVGVDTYGDPQTKNISNKCIANAVGVDDSVDPHFEEHTLNKKSSKAYSNLISNLQPLTSKTGITLIALIITIIVMLILVGVTINVALNGGLFEKAQKATYQTGASEIQEQVEVEKAIKIAENNGKVPENYNIQIEDLDISKELKNKFKNKLIISNGTLYYDGDVVTDLIEQGWLEEIGIYKFEENISTEIHLGDKWDNVTFKDLSNLDESSKFQAVLLENNAEGVYYCIFSGNTGIASNFVFDGEVFGMYCNDDEGEISNCIYIDDAELRNSEEVTKDYEKFNDSGWMIGKAADRSFSKNVYPISGEVVGLLGPNEAVMSRCDEKDTCGLVFYGLALGVNVSLVETQDGCIDGDITRYLNGNFNAE